MLFHQDINDWKFEKKTVTKNIKEKEKLIKGKVEKYIYYVNLLKRIETSNEEDPETLNSKLNQVPRVRRIN